MFMKTEFLKISTELCKSPSGTADVMVSIDVCPGGQVTSNVGVLVCIFKGVSCSWSRCGGVWWD